VIEHKSESWGAYCPDLPGVGVVGESRNDVERLIREAVTFHLDGLREAGEPISKRPARPPSTTGTALDQLIRKRRLSRPVRRELPGPLRLGGDPHVLSRALDELRGVR
jgi:predicted RNase H-like HicB family nuclease